MSDASVMPCAVRLASMLFHCAPEPVPEPKNVPRNVLPPVLGTMFRIGPPVSASPRLPEIDSCISCALATSYALPETPPPLKAAPTFKPSSCTVPSLAGPPWTVKNGTNVDADELAGAPCIEGTAARMPPYARAIGRLLIVLLSMTASRLTLCVCTTGVAPETLIVSDTLPTFMSALIVSTPAPASSTPSRFTEENPASENVTA